MSELPNRSVKKKSLIYKFTKKKFANYAIWFEEFFIIHHRNIESISDNLDNYYKMFDDKFFSWLNQPKNYLKFMFEIKNEFMAIAYEVLIYEIMILRFKKPENYFIIPVLQESSENESHEEIDSYPDHNPCYNLMEENQVPQEYTSDNESTVHDDNMISAFFL